MLGYWRDTAATAKSIDEAPMESLGDLAIMDEGGVRPGQGENQGAYPEERQIIVPRDIEEIAFRRPLSPMSKSSRYPIESGGRDHGSRVRCRPGQSTTKAELERLCASALPAQHVPRYWRFVDTFPTNIVGKNVKYLMQEQAATEDRLE